MHRKPLHTFAAILTAITLSGCATSTGAPDETAWRAICESPLAAPITFSDADTAETRLQIEEHNAAYECSCNNDCPP